MNYQMSHIITKLPNVAHYYHTTFQVPIPRGSGAAHTKAACNHHTVITKMYIYEIQVTFSSYIHTKCHEKNN
jgi:hypothetical protein